MVKDNNFDIYEMGIVMDVTAWYDELKENGETGIVTKLLEEFEEELEDEDDGPLVYVGLALATLKHTGKVPARIKKKVLELMSGELFDARYREVGDQAYYRSFCEWKNDFKKQVENGVPLAKKERKKYKKLPVMKVGDIFQYQSDICNFDHDGRTILLIFVDRVDFLNRSCPVFYLAVTKSKIQNTDDVLNARLCFLPVSVRFSDYDYRRVLLDKSLPEEICLRYVGNVLNYPRPATEFIPNDIVYYDLFYLSNMSLSVETGIRILKGKSRR